MKMSVTKLGWWGLLLAGFWAGCANPLQAPLTEPTAPSRLINLNPNPDGEPWLAGGMPGPEAAGRVVRADIPTYQPPLRRTDLPARIDNSQLKYFRPIFVQADGSCGQASGVGYTYTYEINRVRDRDASRPENQYPTHFTYNFLNGGSGQNGSWYYDGWEIIKQMGIPNVADFGGLTADPTTWASGYALYRQALANRLTSYRRMAVGTVDGLDNLKQWLAHHGDGSPVGGLVVFAAGAVATRDDSAQTKRLSASEPAGGQYVILHWGATMNHAMTFVGYDDTVRYDYNGDGLYTNDRDTNGDGVVDLRDWEVGALIVANSWGTSWGDNGRAYMMYRLLAEPQSYTGQGGVFNNEVYILDQVPAVSFPKASLKVELAHSQRARLALSVGLSTDLAATQPTLSQRVAAFQFTGGDLPLAGVCPNRPLEIGLDLTALVDQLPPGTPFKAFLTVTEGEGEASGKGQIRTLTLIDHENGDRAVISAAGREIAQNRQTSLSLVRPAGYQANFPSLAVRGDFNGWGLTPLTKTADHSWTTTVELSDLTGLALKFDVRGDWSTNFGDSNQDGVADLNAANIRVDHGGTYRVTFNDQSLAYSLTQVP